MASNMLTLSISLFFILFKSCSGQNYSLGFVIDTTGSMTGEVERVKSATIEILDKMMSSPNFYIEKFTLVPFNDPSYGPAITTTDPESFKKHIQSISVYGGGDCPELCFSGLMLALNESLPNSYIYVFTDAPAKDYRMLPDVVEMIQVKKSQVSISMTNGCYKPTDLAVYDSVAQASNGQVFELIKGDISKLMDYIEYTISMQDKVNMAVVVNPPGYGYIFNVSIDITISIVSVTVSGSHPQIIVTNPMGEIINNTAKVNITVDLDKLLVVNIINPEPGIWEISCGSSTQHSVKIIAISEIRFDFGFFTDQFSNIVERPNQNQSTYVMIKLVDDNKKIEKLESIEIIDVNGLVIIEIPLIIVSVSSTGLLYKTTEQFIVPIFLFSISIKGIDIEGNIFKRISSTPILAIISNIVLPEPLFHEIPKIENGNQNESLIFEYGVTAVIQCNVTGIPIPTITWILPNGNKTETICNTYIINQITQEDEGIYKCIATNTGGIATSNTTVIVKEKKPIETEIPKNKSNILNPYFGVNIIFLILIVQFFSKILL